ncbi:MAG: substrate-binding and VWA domain-containing protein [Actinomycetota bacterium]|nr:substrate-binding and VWA domain-containing protein [Actinomycetota bacterium]MDQ3574889.1 substrate-binding and VWA domain-containing protein [Actinomycetota bacterium]
MRTNRPAMAALVAMSLLVAACSPGGDGDGATGDAPKGCTTVTVTSSPEKFELLTMLGTRFNRSKEARAGEKCAFVQVKRKSSGEAAAVLADGWRDEKAEGPRPVIWSPSASTWGGVLNQRLEAKGQAPMAPADARPFMLTPLVIAMPKPMADALGYPATPVGYADLIKLAQDPAGWASKGHPEWGAFKLGKTNPNFSTSALSATVGQYYAATGKVRDLTLEDVEKPSVEAFNRAVESSVVHYGDITLTFLNNWFRNDARGTALTYVSAVAVEEKSVIDYNSGNPDGITDPGERPRPPKTPLVAIYPKEGTLFSDNPFYVLDAPWVGAPEKEAARAFEQFVQAPDHQAEVVKAGFRPGNPAVPVGPPVEAANGVDPKQPQTALGVPSPPVLVRLIDKWGQQRREARVLLVIDVSGSMGDDAGNGQTKLDLAKRAAVDALSQFKDTDTVGLRTFSTNVGPKEHPDYVDLVPIGPAGANREQIATKIRNLVPTEATPLYTVARDSFRDLKASYDPARINAVLLLTDGQNEDPRNNDLEGVVRDLRTGSEGVSTNPVRLFTIAYGSGADLGVLKRLAEATNAAAYDASDPATIGDVFTAVVSNF